MLWFFFDAQAVAICINFGNTISFWVVYIISENGSLSMFCSIFNTLFQQFGKTCSMKDVVTENQTNAVVANKLFSDNESLCKTVRTWLFGIFEFDSNFMSITKKATESRKIMRS